MNAEKIEFLSIEEAADFIGLPKRSLAEKAKAGVIVAYKPGKRMMFLKADLVAFMKRNKL